MTEPTLAAPTARRARAAAPDVARGLVLVGIALANVPFFLYGAEVGLMLKPATEDPTDQWTNAFVALLFDNRSYPLFALLFGYGMTQLMTREYARGASWEHTRGLLIRRNLWLIAFGAAHGILLFFGDILGPYGLLGLGLVLLIRASGKVLAIVGWICFGMLVLVGALEGLSGLLGEAGMTTAAPLGSAAADTFGWAVLLRAGEWLLQMVGMPLAGLGLLAPMILGIWLARHRVLENPTPHLRRLGIVAGLGILVSLLGALPVVLGLLGFVRLSPLVEPLATMLHAGSGAVGAVGYVAFIAILAGRRATPGPIGRIFAALGQRSLSGYLAQSLVFVVVFAPYALGLGGRVGIAEASQIAVITWLGTLIVANVLAAIDRPGPAEWLLRKLVYRPVRGPVTPSRAASSASPTGQSAGEVPSTPEERKR
jgi:uncharacterized protein